MPSNNEPDPFSTLQGSKRSERSEEKGPDEGNGGF